MTRVGGGIVAETYLFSQETSAAGGGFFFSSSGNLEVSSRDNPSIVGGVMLKGGKGERAQHPSRMFPGAHWYLAPTGGRKT